MSGKPSDRQAAVAHEFQELHRSGCFLLPNAWDPGSAAYLGHIGFQAVATTSGGYAFSCALPDEPGAIQLEGMLDHLRAMVAATPLPVSADFQNGYVDEPAAVARHAALCIDTGVAGFSIEDAGGPAAVPPLYDERVAAARIAAARSAIDASGLRVVLTGRCEAYLVGDPDPLATALRRLAAYADAGADCLFAPGVRDPGEIAQIVRAVAPKPVNVLINKPHPELDMDGLAALGVRRVSVGAALARVAWGAFIRAARTIAETGSFDSLGDAANGAELEAIFRQSQPKGR